MSSVAVIIISYNTCDQLRRCLVALRSFGQTQADVTVVDNASSDGSAEMVALEFPEVCLIAHDRNLGFAGGINTALRDGVGDYVMVLNPDVRLSGEALAGLQAFLDARPDAAAVAPLLRGNDGAVQSHMYRRFPSAAQLALFWTVLAPLSRRSGRLRRRYFEHDLRGQDPISVDQIPGAAMLIRASALREVGAFDPDYFIWFEDVDWCYRALQCGCRLFVLPAATAVHDGGASFRSWSTETRVFQFYRAFFRFLCKHRLDHLLRFALPVLTADLFIKQVALAVARPWRDAPGRDRASLAATRRAIRRVIERYAAGEIVRYTDADVPGLAHAPRNTSISSAEFPLASRDDGAVDVIIVNWNGRRYLPGCLAALYRCTIPVRILVVDNASTDGSVAWLRTEHPDVEVLALDENVGYAAGANAGLRATRGEYAMVMNPDVALAAGHLEVLRDRLERLPEVGAAQGRLYGITAQEFERGAEPKRTIDSAGHVIHRSRMVIDRGQGQSDDPAFDEEKFVFSACGAALFLRRSMLDDIAPTGEFFAETMFAYKEDIDLCWRARLLGWQVLYVPDAVAHHVRALPYGAASWKRTAAPARRHSWKNHYLLMMRNDRVMDILRDLPFVLAWELGRIGHALFRDPAVLPAYIDVARLVGRTLRERRALMARRRAPTREIRAWFGAQPRPARTRERPAVAAMQ